LERLGVWALRALWGVLPFTAGDAFGEALAGSTALDARAVTIGLWVVWAGVLLALLVPHPITLTAVRLAVPAAPIAVGWALAAAAAATVLALLPTTADAFVDGASYGSERRFALRPPLALWLGPIPVVWALAVAGSLAGPLLLAERQWVAGGLAVALGWSVAA